MNDDANTGNNDTDSEFVTFDALKSVMKDQDKSKRTLDLAGIADGMLGHMLSDPDRTATGIAEGRFRKRAEIQAAADEWAE